MHAIKWLTARPDPKRSDCVRHVPFFAVFAALVACAPVLVAAETLKIGGTGSGLPTMALLAAEFSRVASDVSVIIVPNLGSSGGLKALRDGVIDIAITSRAMKTDETAQGLVALEYGKTALVFATNNPADRLGSVAELVDVYSGKRTDWADGRLIRLILRPRNDGDTALLQAISPQMKQAVESSLARPGMSIASTDQDMADALERTDGAVGVTTLSLIQIEKRRLSMLSLNGVMPSAVTIADGSYPFAKPMYLVRSSAPKEAAVRFTAFVASPRGRQLLLSNGHWVPTHN